MDDPEARTRVQPGESVLEHGDGLIEGEIADNAPERAALLVAHGHEGRSLSVEYLVNGDDVRVVQLLRDLAGRLEEPGLRGRVRSRHRELLERHDRARLAVAREMDDPGWAGAELADDLVAAGRPHLSPPRRTGLAPAAT